MSALCYDSETGLLCYCRRTGAEKGMLVYKSNICNVFISWDAPNRDLDICAYWLGYSEGKVGWSWSRSVDNGTYSLQWYGDNTKTGGSEHVLPNISPKWSSADNRVLRIHLNYYGESVTGTCNVKATSADGEKQMETVAYCASREGYRADVQDPYVDITFDASGNPVTIQ